MALTDARQIDLTDAILMQDPSGDNARLHAQAMVSAIGLCGD